MLLNLTEINHETRTLDRTAKALCGSLLSSRKRNIGSQRGWIQRLTILGESGIKLKRELSAEISEELTANFLSAAPKALSILMDLAENSTSDSVKFQASKDLLDRAGFRPIDRREEIRPQRTTAELEAEIKRLVGTEKAELLLGKKSVDDLVQERVEQQEKASIVN